MSEKAQTTVWHKFFSQTWTGSGTPRGNDDCRLMRLRLDEQLAAGEIAAYREEVEVETFKDDEDKIVLRTTFSLFTR